MKTVMAKKETVSREWLLIDAAGLPVGRVASKVAFILRGKHKPCYTPHVDTGDYVIVINTDKMVLTGKKLTQKYYFRYSGYPGGSIPLTAFSNTMLLFFSIISLACVKVSPPG